MKNPNSNSNALTRETRHTLFTCGLWIRIGFVGASGVLAGLLMLLDAESSAGRALLVFLGGAALTAMSLWRIRSVLGLLDAGETRAHETSRPVKALRTASASRSASITGAIDSHRSSSRTA